MIIYVCPMIAGFTLRDVNTQNHGIRCAATRFTLETARDTAGKSNGCTRIKRRAAQGAGNTRTALTRPIPLGTQSHKRREGQAVQKPRSSLYAMSGRRGVTYPHRHVADLTVSVVAR